VLEHRLGEGVSWNTNRGRTMRSQRLDKDSCHREMNDIRDWYLIGFIALAAALVTWLPLLSRGRF